MRKLIIEEIKVIDNASMYDYSAYPHDGVFYLKDDKTIIIVNDGVCTPFCNGIVIANKFFTKEDEKTTELSVDIEERNNDGFISMEDFLKTIAVSHNPELAFKK